MPVRRFLAPFALFLAVLSGGCSSMSPWYRVSPIPTQHVVLINSLGRAVDPTGNRGCSGKVPDVAGHDAEKYVQPQQDVNWEPCEGAWSRYRRSRLLDHARYDRYLADQFRAMDRYFSARAAAGHNDARKVVIFFHGGLNNTQSSLKRVRDDAKAMVDDGYYPIFVNWQSALTTSLLEHEFIVRQGEWRPEHWYLFPFYIAGDVGKSVGRAPAVAFYNVSSDIETGKMYFNRDHHTVADSAFDKLYAAYQKNCGDPLSPECNETIALMRGDNRVGTRSAALAATKFGLAQLTPTRVYVHGARALAHTAFRHVGLHVNALWTWAPLRFLAGAFLDGFGTPAWDLMIRHYQLAFQNENVRGSGETDGVSSPPEGVGAASELFRQLRTHMKETASDGAPWEMTLIGHSMGSFMVNETLQRFPDLPVRDVVYLAAACTVDQYEQTAFPYLKAHDNVRWHHVTLHEMADRREDDSILAPRGSLLVWIDSFFSKPATLRERTAGRYENLIPALNATPKEIRGRITVRTFGIGTGEPEKHHDVGARTATNRYWREDYWFPRPARP